MRLSPFRSRLVLLSTLAALGAAPALAAPSPPSPACAREAAQPGPKSKDFVEKCKQGALAPTRPSPPSGPDKEAKAVTQPSGVDRTTRSKECSAAADKRRLTGARRKQFRLSCLATAGPVSESETQTTPPRPAKAIPGIGINNNKDQPH